jgi:DNA replication and repair protein RecF
VLIKSLNINNLRNLKSVDIDLHPELNFLVGDNGAGKTSVLESVVVLAKGRSFRSGQVGALIGPEGHHFRVVATTSQSNDRQQILGIERSRSEWKARRNGEDVTQLSDLAAHLPLVLMEPNSHLLVSGPPEGRRRFLDWGVFHVEQEFLLLWRRYSRALKQRNAALRKQDPDVLDSLDEVLSDLGEKIAVAREQQIDRLNPCLKEMVSKLSPELGKISIRYEKGWKGDSLKSALIQNRGRDLDRCATGPGPHKSDLPVFQDKLPARDRLSRGEQKILSAALLLSQASLMSQTGEKPVLLLDDLASEFDQAHLAGVMAVGRQMQMFHVEHGRITSETIA